MLHRADPLMEMIDEIGEVVVVVAVAVAVAAVAMIAITADETGVTPGPDRGLAPAVEIVIMTVVVEITTMTVEIVEDIVRTVMVIVVVSETILATHSRVATALGEINVVLSMLCKVVEEVEVIAVMTILATHSRMATALGEINVVLSMLCEKMKKITTTSVILTDFCVILILLIERNEEKGLRSLCLNNTITDNNYTNSVLLHL